MFYNSTIRQTVQVGLEADTIRLRLSNVFGVNNLNISSVAVSLSSENKAGLSTLQAGSTKEVQFSGNPSISVPNGGLAVSDPIKFPVQARSVLMIDLFLENGQDGFAITGHPGSRTTSFMTSGDFVGKKDLTQASVSSTEHWWAMQSIRRERRVDAYFQLQVFYQCSGGPFGRRV